jgi:two-component system, chemotaxis family, chemotaxis protein CheY
MPHIVLIVDDNETVAMSLASAVEAIPDVKAIMVGDGHAALRVARDPQVTIHALITDFDLPHLDGFSLIEEIRRLPLYTSVPVLMITGHSDRAAKSGCRVKGPNIILPKPFSCREVRRVVEQMLA